MRDLSIEVPGESIAEYCRRWLIVEFAFFGSVLREDFHPESDIDVLVTFADEARWTLFDFVRMKEELSKIMGRGVDLVSRRGVEAGRNPVRREAILSSARVVHVA